MNWTVIDTDQKLEAALNESETKPVVFFKHSNRCSISTMAKDRFERHYQKNPLLRTKFYYIDVVVHRPLSLALAAKTGVAHESPQVIVLHNTNVLYHQSHMGIDYLSAVDCILNIE